MKKVSILQAIRNIDASYMLLLHVIIRKEDRDCKGFA